MPDIEAMLLKTAGSTFFGETGLVLGCFQIPLDPDDAAIHTLRGEDAHVLYEPIGTLRGFEKSGIHMHGALRQDQRKFVTLDRRLAPAKQVFRQAFRGHDPLLGLVPRTPLHA